MLWTFYGMNSQDFQDNTQFLNLPIPHIINCQNPETSTPMFGDSDFVMPSHLLSNGNPLAPVDFETNQSRRRADEVERIGSGDCKVTTSFATEYSLGQGDGSASRGIMTTFQASREIEILTLEFSTISDAVDGSKVQVYFREGHWAGNANDRNQWTKLAEAFARLSPDGKGAIIPTSDFTSVTIKQNVEYALYLHFDRSDVLRVKDPSGGLIGDAFGSDGVLTSFMGVPLAGDPFAETRFDDIAAFEGVFHYLDVAPCTETLTTSDVVLEFAMDSDPDDERMDELSQLVAVVMDALMKSDRTLLDFQDDHLLSIGAIETNFWGRNGTAF